MSPWLDSRRAGSGKAGKDSGPPPARMSVSSQTIFALSPRDIMSMGSASGENESSGREPASRGKEGKVCFPRLRNLRNCFPRPLEPLHAFPEHIEPRPRYSRQSGKLLGAGRSPLPHKPGLSRPVSVARQRGIFFEMGGGARLKGRGFRFPASGNHCGN